MITGISISFAFISFFMWHQSQAVKLFNHGLTVNFPVGAFIMTYKTNTSNSLHDPLIHAASYYGIFKHCVNIGNYETNYDYFPVKFKSTIPKFPMAHQIVYAPRTINLAHYPSVQYILEWEISSLDKIRLSKYYHFVFEAVSLTVWKRNLSFQPPVLNDPPTSRQVFSSSP